MSDKNKNDDIQPDSNEQLAALDEALMQSFQAAPEKINHMQAAIDVARRLAMSGGD
jgi:hypothetical protein